MVGLDKFFDRSVERERNQRFMDADRVEDEEMMNRLYDREDF